MRGQHSLFTQFFNTTQIEAPPPRTRNCFQVERNQLLVHRYYFYMEIKGYNYQKCLEELEKDMFLTAARMIDILTEYRDGLLTELYHTKPAVRDLAKLFPRLNWNL